MQNKVLIITNEFIPYTKSLGGCIRILSLSNFLIKNNFDVHLLTSKSDFQSYYGYEDIYKKINVNFINKKIKSSNSITNLLFKIIQKIIKFFFYNFYNSLICLGFDQATLRLKQFKIISNKIIKKNNINNVIISSPPFSLFLISKYLKINNKNINIIHDYRDSWTLRFDNKKNLLKKIATKYLEQKSLLYCNYVICASETIASKINTNFKVSLLNKPIVVFNGYHLIDKSKLNFKNNFNNKKINIGYFGMINDDSKGYRDIKIIYNKIKNNKNIIDNFCFYFYGPNIIKRKEINNFKVFNFFQSIDHKEALSKMNEMNYLLLIHSEELTASEVLTGKIFDYIFVKKPIIIISKGSTEAGKLITKHKLGLNIDLNKYDLVQKLNNLINEPINKINLPSNIYDSFSRDYQNKKIINILDE